MMKRILTLLVVSHVLSVYAVLSNFLWDNIGWSVCYLGIEYWDLGDPSSTCKDCGAQMWYGERVNKSRNTKKPKFGLCCGQGKIKLPLTEQPPALLKNLLTNNHPMSKHFIERIRPFNQMFSFTSMGGKIDHSVNKGKGPYTFRMGGQNYHKMGSLVPTQGNVPKFSQLYIYDTEEDARNMINATSKDGGYKDFEPTLVHDMKSMIDYVSPIAKSFRMAAERIEQGDCSNVRLKLIGKRTKDGRQYNLPTASEVVALIIGDIDPNYDQRDIVVDEKSLGLQRINEYHASYLEFQYPLLFIYGEDGFRNDVPHATQNSLTRRTRMV